jgi:hypothetical protein
MGWFARLDRFGSGHMVRSPDASYGCGISSVAMVNFKMKKGLLAAGMAAGTAVTGQNVDLNAQGARWDQYPAVLEALGLGTWIGVDTAAPVSPIPGSSSGPDVTVLYQTVATS